jgi:NAD(P)-dependent dehydrogenase (short-subunit alcohol dehydrogenase family)
MRISQRTKILALSGAVLGAASAAVAVGTAVAAGAAVASRVRRARGTHLDAQFEDKVVVITGASRGLGLALAEAFGRAGARLVLAARDPYELERARSLLLERGAISDTDRVLIIPFDLREEAQAGEMIARATRHFGRVDVLVNNAGIITVGPVEQQSLEAFRDAMNTNFFGMLHCTQAVLPQMLARHGGSIVNITSIGGKIAVPHLLPYSASKFAAVGLSEGLHVELRAKGIQVTTVVPGLMRTGSHIRALFSGDREKEYRWFSLGAGLPLVSASAASAAKKIVAATARGATEITITPQAYVAARLAGLAPPLTQVLLHLSTFALPASKGDDGLVEGRQVRGAEVTPLVALANSASTRYNED